MDSPTDIRITSVEFRNYKAFRQYSISLQSMNILVGPNNCGKSTITGAFKILNVGLRRARARRPDIITGPDGPTWGYVITEDTVPVSLENVHTDYADTDTTITFRLSNSNRLQLYFPQRGGCVLVPVSERKLAAATPIAFRQAYPITLAVVPVLGPVEHQESRLQMETVQRDLDTHRASRHFRNYWYYFSDHFDEFATLVARTWPGMQIQPPETSDEIPPHLLMFCLEKRITRELYWAGSGFQIWCQLLTHVATARNDALLVVDEPEIYLHPDVQRQLLGILRQLPCDILIATHSAEIIGEAEPSEILMIDKQRRSAERIKNVEGVQSALSNIGSGHNITLTRLARSRRVLFVEGSDDFAIIRRFAHLLGFTELAAGVDITAVASEGFSSWERVQSLGWGIEKALGERLSIGVIYDRDYHCEEEVSDVLSRLRKTVDFAHIHHRKEIENYLLVPEVLERAVLDAIADRNRRCGMSPGSAALDTSALLGTITAPMRSDVASQYVAKRTDYLRRGKIDTATITAEAMKRFDQNWQNLNTRTEIVPGKQVLAEFRNSVQLSYGVTLTNQRIIGTFKRTQIPSDLCVLISSLEEFRTRAHN